MKKRGCDVRVKFSLMNGNMTNWLTIDKLITYNNTSPIITFGNIPSLMSKVHSWVCIKEKYVKEIISGEKTIENRPPKPQKGSWLNSPTKNKKVILGVIRGADKKLNKPPAIVAFLTVIVKDTKASQIYILKCITITPHNIRRGFPSFMDNGTFQRMIL
jgi:hypothetical protein